LTTLTSREIAVKTAYIASEKKAEDIVVYSVESITYISEYFVVCSGLNERHLLAVANDIKTELKENKVPVLGIEGHRDSTWILIDAGGVIIHLFSKVTRAYYDLDLLWGDAPKIEWEAECGELTTQPVLT